MDAPWGTRPSIHDHVVSHADPETGRLRDDGQELPDDAELFGDDDLRWVAGGLDGAFGHHGGGSRESDRVTVLFKSLQAALER
ncbi:MAG: hypothetical protein AAF533_20735 [Acidobacteriota bacterium]